MQRFEAPGPLSYIPSRDCLPPRPPSIPDPPSIALCTPVSSTASQVLFSSDLVGELCLLVKHVIVVTHEKAMDILVIWEI